MKKIYFLFFVLLTAIAFSCNDNDNSEYYTMKVNKPVYVSKAEFRSEVTVDQPQPLQVQGKICLYKDYLFISDPQKGIHIIDNRNPRSPQNVGYLELLGNSDLAVRNDMLYADSYIDLVWFDISNPAAPQQKGRFEDAFPYALPICDNEYSLDYDMLYGPEKQDGIVIDWQVGEKRYKINEKVFCDTGSGEYFTNSGSGSVGKTGSMSRFAIYQDYLYAVINNQLHIMDLNSANPTQSVEPIWVGWNAETIFSYKNCMYFGTPTGMLIYSVENPLQPEFQSSLTHAYGCDPVVVEDDLAYVTIWSGNNCGQSTNELFIIDVSDVKKPKQIVSYGMTSPKGLGIDNKTLFVCDDGLKIFDAKDPQKIMSNTLAHYKGMDGFDVIPSDNKLMMIATDGLYQYDYSDLQNIKELSKLTFAK